MNTEKPITYRGEKYYIFESEGKKYVSIDDITYTIINKKNELSSIIKNKFDPKYDKYLFNCKINSSDFKINSVFKNNFVFRSCIFIKNADLSNCKIADAIFCEDSIINKVEFITDPGNCVTFEKKVEFIGDIKTQISTASTETYPVNSNENAKLTTPFFIFKSVASFVGAKYNNIVLFLSKNDSSEGSLIFRKCHFEEKLKIRSVENCDYETQQKNKASIKELKIIDCTASKDAYLRIGFLAVDNFELSNLRLPQNAELNIGDCHFQSFKLTNFRNVGKFKLFKINVIDDEWRNNDTFSINNTSIGDADFQSLDLTFFKTVKMFDNILSGIDYTNVQWGEDIEVGQYGASKETKIAKKQDTYRTLKNVAQKNNDQPRALIFYAKEMEQHQLITKANNSLYSIDRVILGFNYWTNKFGLNWQRPLLWLLPISIVFYALLLLTSGIPLLVIGHWGNYFEFLNPTHKTEFIGNNWNWGGLSYFIDFAFRIIEGLLIYQTIQAFRKYSRKL